MKLLKTIFDKEVKMLGRAGIIYKLNDINYFVDSESLAGNPSVIFYKNIYVDDDRSLVLSNKEKIKISDKLKSKLEAMGIETIIQ